MGARTSDRTGDLGRAAGGLSRRELLGGAVAAAAASALAHPKAAAGQSPRGVAATQPVQRKVKLGVVGCGGRGGWIAKLFAKHGGYEMHAVADYFQAVADRSGDELGVAKERRFAGLGGCQRLIASGVEAVALETPPYFFPQHAQAAAEAGLHIYMAKPVAVDVPGCLTIQALGRKAAEAKRCFRVDYQMPTDPVNIEVADRVRQGALGKLAQVATIGITGGFPDPPKTANYESRLQGLIWCNDAAMGGDYVVNYDIHAIDAAVWLLGRRPVAAMGGSRICRADPHGDSRDVCSVIFEYADGLVHNHFGQALRNNADGVLSCAIHGQTANALLNYWGKAYVRGGQKHYVGSVDNLYEAGAMRNIAAFHDDIVAGRFGNETVNRAVDGALTTILAREAAARHAKLTMDELLMENKRLEIDLSGLKA